MAQEEMMKKQKNAKKREWITGKYINLESDSEGIAFQIASCDQ
jgi:hypothetical protein